MIDKKNLKLITIRVWTVGFAGLTALLAYHAPGARAAVGGDAHCELSTAQVGLVQSVLHDRNESCSYNMTVGAILGI